MKIRFVFTLLILTAGLCWSAAWTPSVVLEPGQPRILFTAGDSAGIANRLDTAPWSSYYSSIWSRANASSGNGSQVEDLARSAIALSAAFVLYFGVNPSGDTLTISQQTALADKARDYLNNMITTMGGMYDNGEYHYPSERLIQYSIAYDLLTGAGIPAPSTGIRELANTLYNNATFWLLGYPIDDVILFMNHKLLVAGALGTASLSLPGEAGDWIDYAMTKINNVTFTDECDPDTITGFAEGPHYFKYSLEHLVQFFMGMKHFVGDITDYYEDPCGGEESASIRTPFFDTRWDKLYYWISEIRLPDGTIPPLDDTFRGEGFCLTAPFAERDPAFFWDTPPGVSRLFIYPMLVSAGAVPAGPRPPGLTSLSEAGNLIFRGDNLNGNIYFHYLGEHGIANASTHNQSDAASFFLHAYGEDLALDPGYISWAEHDRVDDAECHNTILINGSGPSTLTTVEAYIGKAFEITGICFGEVSTSYSSADINRKAALLENRFIVLMDFLESGSSREYTFQCHGNGLQSGGSFAPIPGAGGIWSGEHPTLLTGVVSAPDGLDGLNAETSVHETGYNSWADHTVLRALKNADRTRFLGLLYSSLNSGEGLRLEMPDYPGQAVIRWGAGALEGLAMAQVETNLLTHPGDSTLPELAVFGEAFMALYDSDSTRLKTIYAVNADSFFCGGDLVFKTLGEPIDLGLSFGNALMVEGYLNGPGENLVLISEEEPLSVDGALSWTWREGELELTLESYAHFQIRLDPLNVADLNLIPEYELLCFPNPFNNSTAISFRGSPGASGDRAYPKYFCGNTIDIGIYDLNGRIVYKYPPSLTFGNRQGGSSNNQLFSRPISILNFLWIPEPTLPSGIYYIKANLGTQSVTKRVVYLK
ncbi:heparinase II/III family protein [bacterium]|nr:heparinase II/III family protein [bacterium]